MAEPLTFKAKARLAAGRGHCSWSPGPALREASPWASFFQFNDLASLSLTLLDKGACGSGLPTSLSLGLGGTGAAPGAG